MLLVDIDWSNKGGGELPVELVGEIGLRFTGSVIDDKLDGNAGGGDAVNSWNLLDENSSVRRELELLVDR